MTAPDPSGVDTPELRALIAEWRAKAQEQDEAARGQERPGAVERNRATEKTFTRCADALEAALAAATEPLALRVQATEYVVSALPEEFPEDTHAWDVTVAYRGHGNWAVVRPGRCLSRDGDWDWESIPSERTDEWIAAHRFQLDDALALAAEIAPQVNVNGWTPAGLRARHGLEQR